MSCLGLHISESLLEPNTRGWAPFTHSTNRSDTHEYSSSFDTGDYRRKWMEGRKKEKGKRKQKEKVKSFFTERETKNRHRMEIDGIGICSLLYKLAGTRTRELGRMK